MEMLKKLNENGYITEDSKLAKIMQVFKIAGEKTKDNISAIVLEGTAGSGKTYLSETFASIVGAKLMFLQCYPGMGSEALLTEPNIPAILRSDSQNAIKEGILIKALKNTIDGPTVLVLDEIDKSSSELDSFLLDFLNSGRITNGTEEWRKSNSPIWVFFTSNGERELSDALLNRCRRLSISRPSKEIFIKSLGLAENNNYGIGVIYDQFPSFTLRQAKEYLADLNELEVDFDIDILSQYVDVKNMEIQSLEALEMFGVQEEEIIYPLVDLGDFDLNDRNGFDTIKKFISKEFAKIYTNEYGTNYLEIKHLTYLNYLVELFKIENRSIREGYVIIPNEFINNSIMCNCNNVVDKRYGMFLINNPQGGEIVVEGFIYQEQYYVYLSDDLKDKIWEENY